MKVNRGDYKGENEYQKAISEAIDKASQVFIKPPNTETIYTIKTKEGDKQVSKEIFEYIKQNDIKEITQRVYAEVLLTIEKGKVKASKAKGAQSNKEKNDIAYKTIIDLVIEQGIQESFLQSGKPLLKKWAEENKAILFERYKKQFPHHKKAKARLPLSESTLYQFQQRFKKESIISPL
jgi:hypothetical protein